MDKAIIRVENLSKKYIIGNKLNGTLRETFVNKWSSIIGKRNNLTQEFLALNELNFNVNQGEVLGIIGKNGAGKSTLLKILSRITEPTSGRFIINGRVSSLLEVGTGFHPELTGRENIYLNGTILGMSRKEVKIKFDEIVDFSGVEKFIETPVKHYSSGMYVRLAFAVAAHLEPEILIIDEVLAVGDAEFQKKCLGKMQDVAGQGKTVLLVSHNMNAINSLCNNSLYIKNGKNIKFGNTSETIDFYLKDSSDISNGVITYPNDKMPGDDFVVLQKVEIVNNNGENVSSIQINEIVNIRIKYIIKLNGYKPILSLYLIAPSGEIIFCSIDNSEKAYTIGNYTKTITIPADFFNSGKYSVQIAISTFNPHIVHLFQKEIISFYVHDNYSSETRQGYTGSLAGMLRPKFNWQNDI